MNLGRVWPLSGLLFLVLLIVGFSIAGEPPEADAPATEIADFYVENKDSVIAGSILATLAVAVLVFFANHLRRLFSATGDAPLAPVVLAGAVITATGAAFDSTLSIAMADAAEDVEPESIQTLQALWDNDFAPIALGAFIFIVSAGVSTLKTRALPAWLGWIAIALAVLAVTPIGFFAFAGIGIWIVIVSILLAIRGGRSAPAST